MGSEMCIRDSNISGAAMGLQSLTDIPLWVCAIFIGSVGAALLGTGAYRFMEALLILLVVIMSGVFVFTMLMIDVDVSALLSGVFTPSMPTGSAMTVIALIGTTVVPYNLFLHANLVQKKWRGVPTRQAIAESRTDTIVSIGLGGLITLAVVSTSAVAFFQTGEQFSATSLATQLEPVLGLSLIHI